MTAAAAERSRAQRAAALAKGNHVRKIRSQVKRDLLTGRVTLAAALEVPELASMPVLDLLRAQRRWGRTRALGVIRQLQISESRQVGQLTARQRAELVRLIVREPSRV